MIVLQAALQVVESEGFDEKLDSVRDRIDEIESLHRTRELTVRFFLLPFVSFFFTSFFENFMGLFVDLSVKFFFLVQGP